MIELVQPLDRTSPLASARLHRQLTVEEAAKRAGLSTDEVEWLEDGRVYRFPSSDAALVAALLYATALGVDHREARMIAGLPVPSRPLEAAKRGRLLVLVALAAALGALVMAVVLPQERGSASPAAAPVDTLPPPWKIAVDVLNGSGDINYTRQIASKIAALAYHVQRVGKAARFDYRQSAVFYEPGGAAIGLRLARQLGVPVRPLPGGSNPNRLVYIVGPPNVAGS